jgi:Costars
MHSSGYHEQYYYRAKSTDYLVIHMMPTLITSYILLPQKRMNDEIEQLLIDIRRIGPTYAPPMPKVLFGELFDDEQVEQYYEALVGTLKCAKKRGMIHFKGQMLLKGIHDKVTITIREDGVEIDDNDADDAAAITATPRSFRTLGTPRSWGPTPSPSTSRAATPRSFTTPRLCTPKSFALPTPSSETSSAPPRTFSYQKKKKPLKSPIRETPKNQIAGTFSDTEGPMDNEHENENASLSIATDSELDLRACPRRVVIPGAFRATDTVERIGLPPRKAPSPRWRSNIVPQTRRRPLLVKRWSEQKLRVVENNQSTQLPPSPPTLTLPPKKLASAQRAKSERFLPPHGMRSQRNHLSSEVATQVQDEVLQLLVDIRRVGSNPGEPTVKFGELFDDELVQNTYEALVGTLRSAKRQGLIDFKGQMLLKGMHDHVEISVVEQ